jgi:hypothetical protein
MGFFALFPWGVGIENQAEKHIPFLVKMLQNQAAKGLQKL